MAEKKTLSFRADRSMREAVEDYQEKMSYDDRSDALEEIVKVGLRETGSPVLTRWREAALKASFYTAISAVVFVVLAVTPGVLEPVVGGQIAAVLLTLSASIVAATELARVAYAGDGLVARIRGENV